MTGGFWEKLFTTGPIGELVAKTGINVTRVIEKQHIDESWDLRIPLIYDETFNETIVSEVLTREEEEERVWALLVYVAHAPHFSYPRVPQLTGTCVFVVH